MERRPLFLFGRRGSLSQVNGADPGMGFTLIELLIVIAIILILIAIALPNFLEAQTRAKVTRAAAQLRTIEIAGRTHLSDWGFLYVDFNASYPLRLKTRMKDNPAICPAIGGAVNPSGGGLLFVRSQKDYYAQGIHCPLTTPIEYLNAEEMVDPFSDGTIPTGYESREGDWGKFKDTTAYSLYAAAGPDHVAGDWHYSPADTVAGPRDGTMPYSPTNGTKSNGDMWRIIEFIPSIARNVDGFPTFQTN